MLTTLTPLQITHPQPLPPIAVRIRVPRERAPDTFIMVIDKDLMMARSIASNRRYTKSHTQSALSRTSIIVTSLVALMRRGRELTSA